MTPSVAATTQRPTRVQLKNGLTLVLSRNDANPTLALYGLVKAGAILDPPQKHGLARFVTSMLDRGTRRRTALEQAETIENVGADLHFEGGAETISISATALSEDLGTVLEVVADALQSPAFPPDQIERARDELVVRARIHEENTGFRAARISNEILYPEGHPYHASPIGTESTLRGIVREDLSRFHAAHCGPNNTILVIVGDLEPEAALGEVERAFGSWKPPDRPDAFEVPSVAPPPRAIIRHVEMKGKSQVDLIYAVPGVARAAPDYYSAMLMNYVLGGGSLSSRLMDRLRDRRGLVYGIYSHLNAGIGAGPIQIHGGTNPKNTNEAIECTLEEVGRMRAEGASAAEMEEAKSYLTGVFPVRLETNAGVASQLLGAELYGLGMDYIERYPSIIESVTLEDVAAAARKYLTLDSYALVTVGTLEGE